MGRRRRAQGFSALVAWMETMKYPDNSASTYYRLDEALFTGDPSGYLTGGFGDTGRGITFTVAAGGSAFGDLWDSAHVVWRAKRQLDGSPVPRYFTGLQWSRAYMESLGLSPIADTDLVRIQLYLIGGVPNATSIADFSGGSPQLVGGGLDYGNVSGPQMVVGTGTGGGATGGARSTTTEGFRVEALTGAGSATTNTLAINYVLAWGVDADGNRGATTSTRGSTTSQQLLNATETELYLMLSILKTGSATGGAAEYSVRSRIDTRGTFA